MAVSLEALVPAHHVARPRAATLTLRVVRELLRDRSADRGRPARAPSVVCTRQRRRFFEDKTEAKRLTYGEVVCTRQRRRFFAGRRAARQLIAPATRHRAHRWAPGHRAAEPPEAPEAQAGASRGRDAPARAAARCPHAPPPARLAAPDGGGARRPGAGGWLASLSRARPVPTPPPGRQLA